MGIELANGRLSTSVGSGAPQLPQSKPIAPSIAEGAVFISKPYKRVEFQLQMPDPSSASQKPSENQDGAAPRIAIKASSAPKVVMQVDNTPEKDYSVISLQQEGRQINHDSTVHFSQQYDSYGRPRMGMSREPYDFAFTKFMVKTNQIKYQENVRQSNTDVRKKIDAYVKSAPENIQVSGNSNMNVSLAPPSSSAPPADNVSAEAPTANVAPEPQSISVTA
jgi:hypothetical protein